MRTMVLLCSFVAGLVLLPTSTFAACASTTEGCPSGYYHPCYWTYFGGVRRCMCHSCRPYPGGGGLRPGLMATPKSRAESLIAFGRITTSVPLTRDSLEPPATR